MSLKKPAIPVVSTDNVALNMALSAMKENLEIITGSRRALTPLNQLPAGATNDEIIAAINAIVTRLNYTGQ